MSEFKPVPLASTGRFTRLSDLEGNFRKVVNIVGGDAYSGGVLASSGGAMGVDQIKRGKWITNDRKTEPYAYTVVSAFLPTAATATAGEIYLPGIASVAGVTEVTFGVTYASITGAANFSGSLTLNVAATPLTITSLTAYGQTTSTQTYVAPTGTKPNGIYAYLSISTAGVTIKDIIIFARLKAKHIA